MNRPEPRYHVGQRLVLMDSDPEFTFPHDYDMVVSAEPVWMDYENHPEGGYWYYPIVGKANGCPEDFLTPHVEGQKEYTEELPCHKYFRQRKNKKP